jgi:peptidoglycan/LPS O-acetylase OafA/YrhL
VTAADPVVEDLSPVLEARLPFAEGLRGIAAVVVLLGHCVRSGGYLRSNDFLHASWQDRLGWLVWPGTEMVSLFMLVSGFTLTYAADRRQARTGTADSLSAFFRRRGWRILPTYYVALIFGLVVLALVPGHLVNDAPTIAPTAVTRGGLIAHLLLVQNVRPAWNDQGNGPLWSMAYEAQLYLLFPLLYFASRQHPIATAAAAIATDLIIQQVHPGFFLLGLLRWFAIGILLAKIYTRPWVRRLPNSWLTWLGLAFLALAILKPTLHVQEGLGHEFVWGAAFSLLVLAMTQRPNARANPCNSALGRWLGRRSYSLYALHFPVLWVVYAVLNSMGLTPGWRTLLMLGIAVPACLAVTEVGYRWVEVPALEKVRAVSVRPKTADA